MRIGLAFNQRPDDVVAEPRDAVRTTYEPLTDAYVEWDDQETIDAVRNALSVFGDVIPLEAVDDFPAMLREARVDFLFNMAEGQRGPSREAHVPAIAEFLGVPYHGSDPLTLAITLHKVRTKEILLQHGIPTAAFAWVESEHELGILANGHRYPVFLKPVWEGSSKGIAEANYVETPGQAIERARELLATYRQPVLAEAFLPGEEFTVAILGNGAGARALPIIRYRFDELPSGALPIMGYEAKWTWDTLEAELQILECPAAVPSALTKEVQTTALAAYRVLGCRDWSRVDLRLDENGTPHVLELNPLPGIIPDPAANSCFPRAAAAAGMTYDELIQTAAKIAWRRISGKELMATTLAGGVT